MIDQLVLERKQNQMCIQQLRDELATARERGLARQDSPQACTGVGLVGASRRLRHGR